MSSNSMPNIGPDETIEVELGYQQKLNFEQHQYSLRFSATITNRYMLSGSKETLSIY
ncbi:MAG: hypothetical protein ACJAWQ_002029 [Paraglaciecola sp.]|jgi:hypothetical protein|uniref:hypothetical protein n=1 Tax=uncultured Paraglaciecola sp. TaxID=1765024 RepID=UPI0025CC90F2|nr:hypothetical protein [uncultured Paraglaciecola sp.]